MMELNQILNLLKNKRSICFLSDNDDTTEDVVNALRKKHYKVKKVTSYGAYTVSKRWWQR